MPSKSFSLEEAVQHIDGLKFPLFIAPSFALRGVGVDVEDVDAFRVVVTTVAEKSPTGEVGVFQNRFVTRNDPLLVFYLNS